MKKNKSFSSEFFVDVKSSSPDIKTDYEIFENKDKLDEIRSIIIQNIIDNNIPKGYNLNEYINYEIDRYLGSDISNLKRSYVFNLIDNEINGFGPINELLKDKNVTEIMVNAPDEIYVEIDGKIVRDESISFINSDHILRTIQKIVGPLGRTIDSSSPMVDARLKDGSRINAIIPPLSLKGLVLTIRKFKEDLNSIEDLLRNGTMTNDMALFLEACVESKLNILVCGGTGSGKTTILNILSSFISNDERIITIEDSAELQIREIENLVSLEVRNANVEGSNAVTIRDLIKSALRMRPDRIILGEVRDAAAVDLLSAMNTGHDGSLSTGHANSSEDMIYRLETLVLMGLDIPLSSVRRQIVSALDIIIHLGRLRDKSRRVLEITEVLDCKDGEVVLNPLYQFCETGVSDNGIIIGGLKRTENEFVHVDKMKKAGVIP